MAEGEESSSKAEWGNPFQGLKIDDNSALDKLNGRSTCKKCGKSRKFFCYNCFVAVQGLEGIVPQIKIPVKIDIIKHKNEIDGKSTSAHAAIIAPEDVSVYKYPDIPNYHEMEDVVLIFPSPKAVNVSVLFGGDFVLDVKDNYGLAKGHHMGTLLKYRLNEVVKELDQLQTIEEESREKISKTVYTLENLPVKRAVFIDSTWNQSRAIFKDPRICEMRAVVLQNRISQFWRHQKGSPRWYLATIEAVHQFLLEIHMNAFGVNTNYEGMKDMQLNLEVIPKSKLIDKAFLEKDILNLTEPYCGQYDNLLFFFSYFYDLIHKYYEHDALKAYRRPFV